MRRILISAVIMVIVLTSVSLIHAAESAKVTPSPIGDYVIGPGDVLEVALTTGYEDRGLRPMLVRVSEDGVANIQLVGEIPVAGLEPTEVEQTISTVSVERGVFSRSPHVCCGRSPGFC